MWTSAPSSKSPPPPHRDQRGTLLTASNNKLTNSHTNNPVPPAANPAPPNPTARGNSPHKGPRSNRPNASPTVPTVAGTFSPCGQNSPDHEHGFSSSVIEQVVSATARFLSFRDATSAVRDGRDWIWRTQIRRLAGEIGRELITQRIRRSSSIDIGTGGTHGGIPEAGKGRRWRADCNGVADAGPGVHDAQNKDGQDRLLGHTQRADVYRRLNLNHRSRPVHVACSVWWLR